MATHALEDAAQRRSGPLGAWSERLPALGGYGAGLLVLSLLHRDTLADMARIWREDSAFTHGFLVPLLSLALGWSIRERLLTIEATPSWSALIPLAFGVFLMRLGEAASVALMQHFAFVWMAVALMPSCLGWRAFRAMRFLPPEVNPDSPEWCWKVALWKRMSLWAANQLGPRIARQIG